MGVLGVDSVVVEGWSSCFVVGLVLGVGQDGYFGELKRPGFSSASFTALC